MATRTNTTRCTIPSGPPGNLRAKSDAPHSATFTLRIPMPERLRTPTKRSIKLGVQWAKSLERPAEMKKRKKKVLDVGKEARRASRNSGIAPAATRVVPISESVRPSTRKHRSRKTPLVKDGCFECLGCFECAEVRPDLVFRSSAGFLFRNA